MPLVPGGVSVNLCGNTAIYRWLHSSPYSHFSAYRRNNVHSAFFSDIRDQTSQTSILQPHGIASTSWCWFVSAHAQIQITGIVIFLRANQLAREASTHTPDNTQMLPAASFHKPCVSLSSISGYTFGWTCGLQCLPESVSVWPAWPAQGWIVHCFSFTVT